MVLSPLVICDILHWYFRKYCFTELSWYSKGSHVSLYSIKRAHLLISPLSSSEKSLRIGNFANWWEWIQVFKELNFSPEVSNIILGNKHCSLFTSNDVFKEMPVKYTDLNNHSLCVSNSSKERWYSMKKPVGERRTQLDLSMTFMLQLKVETLHVYFPFLPWNVRKIFTQGSRFSKMNKLYSFIKDISKRDWLFFFFFTLKTPVSAIQFFSLVPPP